MRRPSRLPLLPLLALALLGLAGACLDITPYPTIDSGTGCDGGCGEGGEDAAGDAPTRVGEGGVD